MNSKKLRFLAKLTTSTLATTALCCVGANVSAMENVNNVDNGKLKNVIDPLMRDFLERYFSTAFHLKPDYILLQSYQSKGINQYVIDILLKALAKRPEFKPSFFQSTPGYSSFLSSLKFSFKSLIGEIKRLKNNPLLIDDGLTTYVQIEMIIERLKDVIDKIDNEPKEMSALPDKVENFISQFRNDYQKYVYDRFPLDMKTRDGLASLYLEALGNFSAEIFANSLYFRYSFSRIITDLYQLKNDEKQKMYYPGQVKIVKCIELLITKIQNVMREMNGNS